MKETSFQSFTVTFASLVNDFGALLFSYLIRAINGMPIHNQNPILKPSHNIFHSIQYLAHCFTFIQRRNNNGNSCRRTLSFHSPLFRRSVDSSVRISHASLNIIFPLHCAFAASLLPYSSTPENNRFTISTLPSRVHTLVSKLVSHWFRFDVDGETRNWKVIYIQNLSLNTKVEKFAFRFDPLHYWCNSFCSYRLCSG